MGHVVNPTAFRLGKVLFWKFNFIHFRQKFLFNKYFLLSAQCYKLISWMFQSPLTISYSFNRFLRFLMKRTVSRKFIVFNFISSKFFSSFLHNNFNTPFSYRLIFFFKQLNGHLISPLVSAPSNNITGLPQKFFFSSVRSTASVRAFISGLFHLFKSRRLGPLNFFKSEYRLLKRKNKRYVWIFKKRLIKFLVRLKFSKSLKTSKFFTNLLVSSLLHNFFTRSILSRFNLKAHLTHFFLKQYRLKRRFVFRNKFKNLMVNLELDNLVISVQNHSLQLNMIIFKEFWLDNFKPLLIKTFYERHYLNSRRAFVLRNVYSYLVFVLDYLKKNLVCYFLGILNPTVVKKKVWSFIFSVCSLRSFIIRNYENYFYFFNLRRRKINLKSLYSLFFSKRVTPIFISLFGKFFNCIRSVRIKYFFLNNHLMNAKTVFRFIFKQLMLLRTINKIMYIVLLELRRTRLFAGFKILLRGRFTRRERAFSKIWMSGQIPTSTVTKKLDYYANHFISKFGVGSIRIWLYRSPYGRNKLV